MKKLVIICGLAFAAMGFYTAAFGENTNELVRSAETKSSYLQDTLPGKKRDTTNRPPMPQDTMPKDSLRLNLFALK